MDRKRSTTFEPVFGQYVNHGCDWFLSRGKQGAQAEWSQFSTTYNLLKLWLGDRDSDGLAFGEPIGS